MKMTRLVPICPCEACRRASSSIASSDSRSRIANIAEFHAQVRKNGLDIPDLDVTFYA